MWCRLQINSWIHIFCYLCFPDCSMTSITSPSASTLEIHWNSYSGVTSYSLQFKVVGSTTIAPTVVTPPATSTYTLVYGLRPGHVYEVRLRVFQFLFVLCTDTQTTITGKVVVLKWFSLENWRVICLTAYWQVTYLTFQCPTDPKSHCPKQFRVPP